jgi:hypothetical protein
MAYPDMLALHSVRAHEEMITILLDDQSTPQRAVRLPTGIEIVESGPS